MTFKNRQSQFAEEEQKANGTLAGGLSKSRIERRNTHLNPKETPSSAILNSENEVISESGNNSQNPEE